MKLPISIVDGLIVILLTLSVWIFFYVQNMPLTTQEIAGVGFIFAVVGLIIKRLLRRVFGRKNVNKA